MVAVLKAVMGANPLQAEELGSMGKPLLTNLN